MEPATLLHHNNPPAVDMEAMQADVTNSMQEIARRADDLALAANRAAVVDADTEARAITLIKQISIAAKAADDLRKAKKQPFLEAERYVDSAFKPLSERLDTAKRAANQKLTAYQVEERQKAEAERRRQEDAARAAAEEAARAQTAEAAHKAAEAEAVAARAAEAAQTVTRTEFGNSASLRTTWVVEITDLPKLLNSEFGRVILSQAKVVEAIQKAAGGLVKQGIREMPGVTVKALQQSIVR